jgi:hypothetical protein
VARISPRSQQYRTKKVICQDLAVVLSHKALHFGTKRAVVDQVLWVWSEFEGKYKGCRVWSMAAKAAGVKPKGLVHEHLVPRKIVRHKLFSIAKPTAVAIHRVLNRWCVGIVITKEEDQELNRLGLNASMPKDWNGHDRWARYTEAGIAIAP